VFAELVVQFNARENASDYDNENSNE